MDAHQSVASSALDGGPHAVDDNKALAGLIAMMRKGPVAVLTGAGLSTASGIPAYRDEHGQWQHPRPVLHQDFLRSEAVRQRYWARALVGWRLMGRAQPNEGHVALAELEQRGRVSMVITQNVDGLHQQAGSQGVIELHGHIGRVCCMGCGERFARSDVQAWLEALNPDAAHSHMADAPPAPDGDAHVAQAEHAGFKVAACPHCGGLLKPDVVFFGDNVPRDRVNAAREAVTQASGLLVIGSSLMVYSGYRFAELAHRLGKPLMAINQGVTRADALLDLKVGMACENALKEIASALDR